MKLFIDASAVVAILAMEPDFSDLGARASEAEGLLTSGIAQWEAVRGLARVDRMGFQEAQRQVAEFVARFEIEIVPIGEQEALLALQAHRAYGKGNHRAQLNMGDCFAYACVKANGAKLLYKGHDFAKTDLA